MKFMMTYEKFAAAILGGVILLFAASSGAQENGSDPDHGGFIRLGAPIRFNPFGSDGGMTPVDPPSRDGKPSEKQPTVSPPVGVPQPKRSLLGIEPTSNGTIQRFSDGSTIELKPECMTETLCNGTKIETLPTGTTIVRWPSGGGVVRYPDGTGSAFHPDPQDPSRSSDLSDLEGTVEVLPGGVVRQTLKDGKTVFDKYPDGSIRSSADSGVPEEKRTKLVTEPAGKDISKLPLNPFSKKFDVESKKLDSPRSLLPFVKPSIRSGTGRE